MKTFSCDKCGNELSEQNKTESNLTALVTIEYIWCPKCGKRYPIVLHDYVDRMIREEKGNIKERLSKHQKVLEEVYREEINRFIGAEEQDK